MKFFRKNWSQLAVLAFVIIGPIISFAQGNVPAPLDASGKIVNPLGNVTTVQGFIKTLLEGALKIGFPLIALAIIYSGFLFVAARGNSEKLTKARESLMYTLIGSAILLGAWAIAQLISETVIGITK